LLYAQKHTPLFLQKKQDLSLPTVSGEKEAKHLPTIYNPYLHISGIYQVYFFDSNNNK